MAQLIPELGLPAICNLSRSEDDTDDIIVNLKNADGTNATVIGWTAVLSLGTDNDDIAVGFQTTYPGLGIAGGVISIDMNLFDAPKGSSLKYDIRITDTVSGDTPARVYIKGSFKVTSRIN